jgi:hypothetical protein
MSYVQLTSRRSCVIIQGMTTTVTTTTISSVTMLGLGAIIALVVVLLLIGFLISKEIMSSVLDERAPAASRVLNVGAVPLFLVFGVIIATKLLPIFG